MRIRPLLFTVSAILGISAALCADTIVLKDGTILGGVVKQVKDGYEISSPDGKATFVPIDDVKSIKLSNDGKVTPESARERLASLRRSVDSEVQIDRIIDRYKQFIEMNNEADAATEAAKDLELWQSRKAQEMAKVGTKWMTPAQRDQHLNEMAKLANEIADQIAAGDIVSATAHVTAALEEDPTNLSMAYLDGVLQLRRNRYNEAKRSFDIVFEQVPEHPPTLFNEAAIATNFKRWSVAMPMFEKVMMLAPNNPEILNGMTEFLRLLPESHRRSVVFDRLTLLFGRQEGELAAEMAKQGLYRFGSGWANQAKIDEMKKKLAEFEEKKKEMQAKFDGNQERIRTLIQDIETAERRMSEIERDRAYVDPITGRIAYTPRPQYYYDLAADRDRYARDLALEKTKTEDIRRQAKELEAQSPTQPFTGRVMPIGEAGVPIVVPAGSGADSPTPTTHPAARPDPLPDATPADATTRPAQP